jgi:hypothetical protein
VPAVQKPKLCAEAAAVIVGQGHIPRLWQYFSCLQKQNS